MGDYIAFFRVGLGKDRLHQSHAIGESVAGGYVEVAAPEAIGAVVAGGISQRLNLLAAVTADKAGIVF